MAGVAPNQNRLLGKDFEEAFLREAKYLGLYARKNHIAAKYGWKGRLIPIKGDLDFRLVDPRTGRVGYFDCKTFQGDSFEYSDIDASQLSQSVLLNEYNVPSGFVVFFRESRSVCFYKGTEIEESGPGKSLQSIQGLRLGSIYGFDLRPVMHTSAALEAVPSHCGKKKHKKVNEDYVKVRHS